MRNRFDELCSFTVPACRTELLQCPEWPLATYFCFLMTTVRLKVLGLLQYFSESTALRPTSLLSFRLDDFFHLKIALI